MKLEHIAISVSNKAEIKEFYYNILEMNEVRHFVLSKALAFQIFNISEEIPVFLMQKEKVIFEIFISKSSSTNHFQHICISSNNRDALYNKAMQQGYTCIRNERKESDMIFIKDKNGNIFEIKES